MIKTDLRQELLRRGISRCMSAKRGRDLWCRPVSFPTLYSKCCWRRPTMSSGSIRGTASSSPAASPLFKKSSMLSNAAMPSLISGISLRNLFDQSKPFRNFSSFFPSLFLIFSADMYVTANLQLVLYTYLHTRALTKLVLGLILLNQNLHFLGRRLN